MILEQWRSITSLGIKNEMQTAEKREIKIINAISFIAAIFNLFFAFWWLVLDIYQYSIINYSMSVVMVGVLILNKTGNYNFAKGIFFITILFHITFISLIFKFRSEFYLFPLIVIAGFVFHKRNLLFLFFALTFIVYLLMTGDFITTPEVHFEKEYTPWVNFIDGIIAMGFTVFALYQFMSVVETNRREIIVKNKLLEEAVNIANERSEFSSLLLKEMNHRVKNNLQMISSLLNMHAESSSNKIARKELLDAKTRIYTIALIHRQLYIENNLTKIDIAKYIDELIPFIKESFPLKEDKLEIKSLALHVLLDVEEAVSLGLILNELITNSVKHGFINDHLLVVKILLYFNEGNQLFLSVENNGKKINKKEFLDKKSFGMNLVTALASSFDGDIFVEEEYNRVALTLHINNSNLVIN